MAKKIDSKLPTSVNVGGIVYKIIYTDKSSDTDSEGRQSIWGQIDYWTRTIRVYKKDRTEHDIWHTIFHEIMHGISQQYQLNLEEKQISLNKDGDDNESTFIDVFSLLLFDTLTRNNFLKFK